MSTAAFSKSCEVLGHATFVRNRLLGIEEPQQDKPRAVESGVVKANLRVTHMQLCDIDNLLYEIQNYLGIA